MSPVAKVTSLALGAAFALGFICGYLKAASE